MIQKVLQLMHRFREGLVQVLCSYPVEALLAVYGCVGCLLTYELKWEHAEPKLLLAPLFFAFALVVNNLAGRGPWRRIYWVCWLPIVPLTLWSGLGAWTESTSFGIALCILAPLAVLACRRAVCNDHFVCGTLGWLRSAGLALFFANVALGLCMAIFFSVVYIFDLEGGWTEHVAIWSVTLCETLAVPLLFLMSNREWQDVECRGSRIIDVLLNYLVTPALLIYTFVLYLYIAKILLSWELPRGGVAYMVFGFMLLAIGVRALQFLLSKRLYDWFFNRFSLLSLPALVLFWAGVVRRTNEYGLTEPRVFLLACGGVMTLCVLMMLSQRVGRYLWVCLAAFVIFAAMAFVPPLAPERLAVNSQAKRAGRAAERLEMIDTQGCLALRPVPLADTLRRDDYLTLYESLSYIAYRDSVTFAHFGIGSTSDLLNMMPEELAAYCRRERRRSSPWVELPADFVWVNDGEFGYIHSYRQMFNFNNDTLQLKLAPGDVWRMSGQELLQRQAARSGFNPLCDSLPTGERATQMLEFRDERVRILFEGFEFERRDSVFVISDVRVQLVMSR